MSQPLFLARDTVVNMSPCSPGSNVPVDETIKQMQKTKQTKHWTRSFQVILSAMKKIKEEI